MKGGRVGNRAVLVEHPSEIELFKHCTNCAILPRPLSHDHFCEKSASLLFHSSAGERLQLSLNSVLGLLSLFCFSMIIISSLLVSTDNSYEN